MLNRVDINDNECWSDFASEFSVPRDFDFEIDRSERERAEADALPAAAWAAVGTPKGGAR